MIVFLSMLTEAIVRCVWYKPCLILNTILLFHLESPSGRVEAEEVLPRSPVPAHHLYTLAPALACQQPPKCLWESG